MIRSSLDSLISAGTVLKKVVAFTPSQGGEGKMTEDSKEDLLLLLRTMYKGSRKAFNFALINGKVSFDRIAEFKI